MKTLEFVTEQETGRSQTIEEIIEEQAVGYHSKDVEKAYEKATGAIQTCAKILNLLHNKGLISKQDIKEMLNIT